MTFGKGTPKIKPSYALLFNRNLHKLNALNFHPTLFPLLALIDSGYSEQEQLIEATKKQLTRSKIFILLAKAYDAGIIVIKMTGTTPNNLRVFELTEIGEKCLESYTTLFHFLNKEQG